MVLDEMPMPRTPLAVKIDTQGAEPLIFEGGMKMLNAAGLIVAEFWPWGMKRMGLDPTSVVSFATAAFPHLYVQREGKAAAKATNAVDFKSMLRKLRTDSEKDAVDIIMSKDEIIGDYIVDVPADSDLIRPPIPG
jgi:hypothetical protein